MWLCTFQGKSMLAWWSASSLSTASTQLTWAFRNYPLGTGCCCDVESTSLTLIQRRSNILCPIDGTRMGLICYSSYSTQVWRFWQLSRRLWQLAWSPANTIPVYVNLTLKALKVWYLNHGDQRILFNLNHHKCLSQFFPLHLNTHVMGLRPLSILLLSKCGDRL